MFYFKINAETAYCGTDIEQYYQFEEKPTDEELDELTKSVVRDNAETYEYLVSGFDGEHFEDMTEEEQEEELENYYQNCSGSWEEVTEEEFLENN